MMRGLLKSTVIAAIVVLSCPCAIRAQVRHGATLAISTVNSRVLDDIVYGSDGSSRFVELIILWRGQDGWFNRVTPGKPYGMRSGSGSSMSSRTGFLSSSQIRGGVTLDFVFDPAVREVRVLGQTISWDTANVILVDRVDSVGGLPFVRAAREDLRSLSDAEARSFDPDSAGAQAAARRRFRQMLSELPALREFLRPSL